MSVFCVDVNRRHQELSRASSCSCWSWLINGPRIIMDKVLCMKAGWWGHKDSGRGPTVSWGLRSRILSPGDTSSQQRTGTISHLGDQDPCQHPGLHMGTSFPRCSLGTHLLLPSTSCQCPAGSCFLGESPGISPHTGLVRFL